ncbi:R-SNARE VAMP72-family protein [Raphidocelis subcapitata]|uniref:R-SNARE VAMP72-family protein n=1 Tax=Raphidocelis subcapitata TaxID=307507 RepID=A0A2V0NS61_9CHLO|nr:R-SNARE VAMP72-family protein [Raphidocelis subcapitata]|eukprot:GBF87675.1 R-SNARE VAMP72-family protein [Raphidocelis subcapitata]
MPGLEYAAVIRKDGTMVAEHKHGGGNVGEVAAQAAQQHALPSNDTRLTVTADGHTFNFLRQDGWLFCVVADEAFGRQVPFAFLDRAAQAWAGDGYPKRAEKGAAHSFDRAFGPRLREYMEHLNAHPESVDRLKAVQQKVEGVKLVMLENVDKVLVRGEKLQALADKTEELQNAAHQFRAQGRQLRKTMWWDNVKVKVAIFGSLFLILAVVIIVLACLAGGNRCTPKHAQ